LDDRFIGYRGSQENEWSWEPDKATRPAGDGTRGGRNIVLAVLSAFAVVAVVVAIVTLVASSGDDGGGTVVGVTSTPTRRPTASPTRPPTTATTTPAATPTASPTKSPTPSPSPIPGTPAPDAEFFLWDATSGKWLAGDPPPGIYSEGDTIVFLLKLTGVEPGESYELAIDYFDCGLSPGQSFDYLAPVTAAGDGPGLTPPGPGRARPDSQVPAPDDPAVTSDAGAGGQLSAWGGAFQRAPEFTPAQSACSGDKQLTVSVLGQAGTLYIEWGGHLATAADWPGKGAASAKSSFGISAGLAGAEASRLEIAPGAVSR
jgi:hypothetical protein